MHPPRPGCVVPPLLEESKEPGKTAVVFQTAGTSLEPCGKHLHLVLCFGGHIPGAGAARAECEHLCGGIQCGGAVAHPAHDAAGPWHGLCRSGASSCSIVRCAVRSVCGVDRPARPLGRLDLCKTGRGHLLRYGLCSHRVSGADPVGLAGVPLESTAAGGRAMHPAGGSCFHRAGQCSQPGCGAHRPCRQRQRAGSGRHPERYRRGAVPGRSFCPERSGKPACPAGRADCGACGRPAHKP